jgi:hypothetical protein
MLTLSGALPLRPEGRGGAAPLDRSTRSPQRAIPFWCATPMGQGDFKFKRCEPLIALTPILLGSIRP